MSLLKKRIYIAFLMCMTIMFSYWMIIEVAGYYSGFYPDRPVKGWLAAILPEIAMLSLMIIKLPITIKIPFIGVEISAINIVSKFLVLLIFIITVTAAGLHVLKPSIKTLSEFNRENILLDLLEKEHRELSKDSTSFERQNQKINLALTAKAKRKNWEEIKDLARKKNSPILPAIEIFLIFLLRIVVQTVNLVFAYAIGYVYRFPSSRLKSTDSSESNRSGYVAGPIRALKSTGDSIPADLSENEEKPSSRLKSTDSSEDSSDHKIINIEDKQNQTFNNAIKGPGGKFTNKKR